LSSASIASTVPISRTAISAVTVCATSHEAAEDLVRELLVGVGAKAVQVLEPEVALR
jgi:hypothetical protein